MEPETLLPLGRVAGTRPRWGPERDNPLGGIGELRDAWFVVSDRALCL